MAKKQTDEPMEGSMPVNDAWTGLLAISLLALGVATGFLAWDWMQYDEEAVARMKIPKLAGSLPKKADGGGDGKKPVEKKVDDKKADDAKKDDMKKDDEKKDDAKKDDAKKDDMKKDDEKKDDKKDEKKDAALRLPTAPVSPRVLTIEARPRRPVAFRPTRSTTMS